MRWHQHVRDGTSSFIRSHMRMSFVWARTHKSGRSLAPIWGLGTYSRQMTFSSVSHFWEKLNRHLKAVLEWMQANKLKLLGTDFGFKRSPILDGLHSSWWNRFIVGGCSWPQAYCWLSRGLLWPGVASSSFDWLASCSERCCNQDVEWKWVMGTISL